MKIPTTILSKTLSRVSVLLLSLTLYTNLASADDSDIITRGILTTKSSSSFVVDAVEYLINNSTEFEDGFGHHISYTAFTVGDGVKAKGIFVGGSLIADSLELEHESNSSLLQEIEGLVTEISASRISLQGQSFDINNSTLIADSNGQAILFSAITIGSKVEVKFSSSSPTIANKIKLKLGEDSASGDDDGNDDGDDFSDKINDVEVVGRIASISPTSITVDGRDYSVTATTRFEDENSFPTTIDSFSVGAMVEIKFIQEGNLFIARKIELEDHDGNEVEVRGPVSLISDSSITVRGVTAAINGQTIVRRKHNVAAQLSDVQTGTVVELKAERQNDNSLVARRISIKSGNSSNDFDDNGHSEKVIYRDSLGSWFIRYRGADEQTTSNFESIQWGLPGDVTVPADYDGDSQTDLAVWRPSTGTWFIKLSSTGFQVARIVQWGLTGDVPLAGDFDGDSLADFAVWRPTYGLWFVFLSSGGDIQQAYGASSSHLLVRQWGLPSHTPKVADRDGDGRADMIVIDENTGIWYTLYSSSGFNREGALAGNSGAGNAEQFGLPGDDFLLGDFDGDDIDDVSVYRDGNWFIRFSSNNVPIVVPFGLPGDIPGIVEAGESSDDSRDRLTVYRPDDGNHFERTPEANVVVTQWGLPGTDDKPVGNFADR
ncbi:MAG: DUF5666 domain-containing protein [bacterium]|nr:DUF5666 domain-containing protein [bacterium]